MLTYCKSCPSKYYFSITTAKLHIPLQKKKDMHFITLRSFMTVHFIGLTNLAVGLNVMYQHTYQP